MAEHKQPPTANSLQEIIAFVESLDISKRGAWFRGHTDSSFELLPSVFRRTGKDGDGPYYNENELLKEFLRRHPAAKKEHSNTLELLTYAQHYGLPTRLLDWSENVLVATYFACLDDNTDGELFILNPLPFEQEIGVLIFEDVNTKVINTSIDAETSVKVLTAIKEESKEKGSLESYTYINGISIVDYNGNDLLSLFTKKSFININFKLDEYELNHVGSFYMYHPPLINKRLIAQNGCFTVHAGKIFNGKMIIPFTHLKPNETAGLSSILIDKDAKQDILNSLRMCGIDKSRLFPELEHQTAVIKELCKF
ncbi:FRG domain-containing protein [Shewanella sp. GD03713]|uniref:FRG domain-containing protein n=1 Tax=Shewanella sp. GD03713 TaxID=2975372 RepID=UPI000F6DFB95|nr:FRG domain-containing protein [Shewanella sp. GD03713]MDH1468840.1 FRG domain-containing protein [Shewanella sp. GD03713]VEE62544.1 FRG domain [Shewanella putrefaciens]